MQVFYSCKTFIKDSFRWLSPIWSDSLVSLFLMSEMFRVDNRGNIPSSLLQHVLWKGENKFFILIMLLLFQDLLEAVVPFDILLDRRKRANFLNSIANNMDTCMKPKVVQDAGLALASLVICEEALERELIISASYVLFVHYHLLPFTFWYCPWTCMFYLILCFM